MMRRAPCWCMCMSVLVAACAGPRALGQCDPLWLPPTQPELAGHIFDLSSHDGHVYAAGNFGEDSWPPGWVQRWNGLYWELLPTGPNGIDGPTSWTYSLMEWQGMVLVGCHYWIGIGEQSSGVAAYDGANWWPLGHAPEHIVALAPAEDGGVLALSLAEAPTVYRYDGAGWTIVGLGPPDIFDEGRVCLAEYQGKVIVGTAGWNPGRDPTLFVLENGVSVPFVQLEYPNDWSGVTSMTIHEGRLVIAGDFSRVGSVQANSVASWDGQTWRPFGDGIVLLSHDHVLNVEEVRSIGGSLFVAAFGESNHVWIAPVARWTGSTWVGHGRPQPYIWAWTLAGQGSEIALGGFDDYGNEYANFARCSPTGEPWIAWQPDDQRILPGASAILASAAADGYVVNFQWYKDGSALSDGPTPHGSVVSGSHEAFLTVLGCRLQDEGHYWCVISNACGTPESRHAQLDVCVADVNSDGFVNGDDLDLFAGWFEDALEYADFNSDGFVNGNDYDEFAERFDQGC